MAAASYAASQQKTNNNASETEPESDRQSYSGDIQLNISQYSSFIIYAIGQGLAAQVHDYLVGTLSAYLIILVFAAMLYFVKIGLESTNPGPIWTPWRNCFVSLFESAFGIMIVVIGIIGVEWMLLVWRLSNSGTTVHPIIGIMFFGLVSLVVIRSAYIPPDIKVLAGDSLVSVEERVANLEKQNRELMSKLERALEQKRI